MSSCSGLAAQIAPAPDPDSATFTPHPLGTRVVVIGLTKATHLNGQVRMSVRVREVPVVEVTAGRIIT